MAVGDDRHRQAARSAERVRRRDREVLLLGGDRVYALQRTPCRRRRRRCRGARRGPQRPGARPLAPTPANAAVGARGAQRALQAGRAGTEAHCLVRVTDEQRVALGLGVESDQVDGICPTVVELAHGVYNAHRRLTAARDRQP